MPAAPDLSGSVLHERYELHTLLGEGTFGRVYQGLDRRLGRIVAVKVIKPWWAEDPEWERRFEAEAKLLARLSDPRIVQIYDVGDGYYVTELVDGESLAAMLARTGPLPPAQAAWIAHELALALAQAHSRRIVHRDIKPANILMTAEGAIKVGDFGVARVAEATSAGAAATAIGTPQYMSPEQAQGEPATPAADVYGAGIVLYEMLAGAAPFAARSGVGAALAHIQEKPPPLPEHVPPALQALTARALAKDPGQRYRDGGELAAALARMPREPVSGRPGFSAADSDPTVASRTRLVDPPPDATLAAPAPAAATSRRRPARRRRPALILLLFPLAALVALLAPGGGAKVRVPQLVGLPRGGVQARLARVHLHARFTRRYASEPSGTAVAQQPGVGGQADQGSTVLVALSGGPQPVPVPTLTGRPVQAARVLLSQASLLGRTVPVPAAGRAPGTVVSQLPAEGTPVAPGSTIVLRVAQRPRLHAVTSFSGPRSVPFRIQGRRWRVDYRMSYTGTCTLLVVCFGPSADVLNQRTGERVANFDLSRGPGSHALTAPPGVYQVRVQQGRDQAQWTFTVRDFY